VYEERLAAARRYVERGEQETLIFLGRLNGRPAGAVVMRIEPTGVAYFRNAFTVPELREHGVYLSLSRHRLQVAREAGCTAAVVQANRQTSSPILQKRGFTPVSRIEGYALVDPNSTGW
jgi:predicted GNAT family acetyltransferase